jgi:hypothetical protein
LPPAYIATAGFDPLRDEGEAYAGKLQDGGIPVALSRQADLPHAYLNFVGIGGRFAEAAAEAAGALRLGLAAARPRQDRGNEHEIATDARLSRPRTASLPLSWTTSRARDVTNRSSTYPFAWAPPMIARYGSRPVSRPTGAANSPIPRMVPVCARGGQRPQSAA